MDILSAIILGIVQGITEFLPVSSSAHLIIVSSLQDGEVLSITMNVAYHMGTLAAVLIYFRRDWQNLIRTSVNLIGLGKQDGDHQANSKLIGHLVIGSLPAGVVGILWKDEIEAIFHKPEMTLIPLALVGILMWCVDRLCSTRQILAGLTWFSALVIGMFQACALIPGTSRSGATIMGGRLFGLSRVDAARFSFLLGTPAMLGAALIELRHLADIEFSAAFIAGIVSSAGVGILSIKFLLSFLSRYGFASFAIYRCLLALGLYYYL